MNNFTKKFLTIFIGLIVAVALAELLCQIAFQFVVVPNLKAQQENPRHYYIPSNDPRLSYQMKPGYQAEIDGRTLRVNSYGFRDDSDEKDYPVTIALFGDSVPFGQGLNQSETPSAELQKLVGDSIKAINFGTCGYGLEELVAYLQTKYDVYRPQCIYYVLNMNDFSRRNSIYEGGDSGLYRIYETPFLKLPFFYNKAIYRLVKGGKLSSVKWYRWMYEGNKDRFLPLIEKMADFAKSRGSEFRVMLFPPAIGYENDVFVMQDIFDEISAYCHSRGIPTISPVEEFGDHVYDLQNDTDHIEPTGSQLMARLIYEDKYVRQFSSD